MKKLITILIFIPFWANAQIELSESYAFKQDKAYHVLAGTGISAGTYLLVYHKTKDEGLAFRAAWMSSAFAAIGKEGFDMMNGKQISLADMSYTIAGGLITSGLMYVGTKIIKKRKQRKKHVYIEF